MFTRQSCFNRTDLYMTKKKALIGNNVLLFMQMVKKYMVLLHMLKSMQQNALVGNVMKLLL